VVYKKGVTLTKDNLAKRNWQGSIKCCFCNSTETIQHLFFDCHFASFIWNTVHITFGIRPPTSIANLFGSWLLGLDPKLRDQIWLGAAALCWAIWMNRNDMVFNKAKANTFIQVIFRATFWIHQWSMLHNEEKRPFFKEGCRRWDIDCVCFCEVWLQLHKSYWRLEFPFWHRAHWLS